MKLKDDSIMPFGKHKGTKMEDVPASYFLWLYDNGLQDGNVKDYIEENMSVLQNEDDEKHDYGCSTGDFE